MHKILLRGGRGANKAPGEFRRSQNWIGGIRPGKARYVPPPPEMVDDLMSDLEKFAHDEDQKLPALVKAALIHVQFETIHPFLDGNGRLGRLLITLLLCADGVLVHVIETWMKARGFIKPQEMATDEDEDSDAAVEYASEAAVA